MSQCDDQWSNSNLGDETPLSTDLNLNSIGGKLYTILTSNYENSLATAKSVSPLLEAEIKEWEKSFPNLLIQGRSIQAEPQSNYVHENMTNQRLLVARKLVLTNIFPNIQKLFRDELGINITAPKTNQARSKSSKPAIIDKKTESKFTLPIINKTKEKK